VKRFLTLLCLLSVVGTAGAGCRRGGADLAPSPVRLTLWHAYGGALGEQFEGLVTEFNATHPGIVVEPSFGGDLWTMRDKLFTAVAGGAAPDLAQIDQFWSSELAEAGAIVRIQDFFGAFDREDVWPLAWETATYDGAIWTMPFALSNIALYYNRALFRAAGLDRSAGLTTNRSAGLTTNRSAGLTTNRSARSPTAAAPPATWDELATAAAVLTADRDGDGQIDQWGLSFPLRADQGVVYYWFAFLWQAGGEIFTEDLSAARFQEVPGVAALTFWQSLVEAGSVPLAPPQEGFEKGQIGMTLASTARLSRYVQALGDDLGVAPLPAGPAGQATGVGGANLAIMAASENKDAAWTFIAWMTSPEVNLRWSTGTGYLPLRRSVVASAAYQAYLEGEPRARVILEGMEVARARPNIPAYAAASREVGLAVEEALFTGADPATALAAAAAKVNKILDAD
jgi:multiple sugar transport system substrate-binding protein